MAWENAFFRPVNPRAQSMLTVAHNEIISWLKWGECTNRLNLCALACRLAPNSFRILHYCWPWLLHLTLIIWRLRLLSRLLIWIILIKTVELDWDCPISSLGSIRCGRDLICVWSRWSLWLRVLVLLTHLNRYRCLIFGPARNHVRICLV